MYNTTNIRLSADVENSHHKRAGKLHQLEKQALKLKENKAEEDSLRETRDELTRRLRTLENVIAAGRQVCMYVGARETATSRMLSE